MLPGLAAAIASAVIVAAARPAPPPAATPTPTPRQAFDRGRTAFGRAEYGRAIEILHPLLYPEVLLDSEGEVVQAHRILGVAYLFENQTDDARREFRKLLELRPDYRFDPLLDPQRVVDFFNGIVKEEEGAIAAIEARRRQRDAEVAARRQREAARLYPQAAPAVVYERRSYLVSFFPFGAGQFQNGDRRKGMAFLGAEAGLAAISVGAFATNLALYGLEPHRKCLTVQTGPCPAEQIDHAQEDTSAWLLRVQLVSGGLFFAVAVWGIVDAVRHFQRDLLLAGASGDRAAGTDLRFTVTPTGLGAAWRF
jgi:tetratricopeptide (TPR) repeat protein